MNKIQFPAGFEWGTATAAAQIEGGWNEDGKGESIWDRFATQPGAIHNGDTTHIACDHYHRFPEDIALMQSLGIKHYRLSISWPRILPAGSGQVNQPGIDIYRRLLTGLRAAGIKPAVTLYHWDLPQVLQDQGGWAVRQTAYDFANYATICFREFGDLVDRWITINEPQVVVMMGYENGTHAPGFKQPEISLQVAHHLLLAHGLAVQAYRASGASGEIGITLNMAAMYPADPSNPGDRQAADTVHMGGARWYADPVLLGGYPAMAAEHFRSIGRYPLVQDGDFEIMRSQSDFLGLNYYMGFACRAAPTPDNPRNITVGFADLPKTDIGWDICPDGFCDLLKRLALEYPGMPLYITENGACYNEGVVAGQVADAKRIDYLKSHLAAASRAITAGVPLKGYYLWSLMDNFEWGHGYSMRFGIVHVDYQTQKRTPKNSALWYRDVMAANGFNP